MSLRRAKKRTSLARTPKNIVGVVKDSPFLEHLVDLRNRLMVAAIGVTIGALIAYAIQKQLVNVLLRPDGGGQHFIYTSPVGGVGFLFSLSVDFGIMLAVPVIVYEVLSFISPALKNSTKKAIFRYCLAAGGLTIVGVVAGYFYGLPLVLKFLSHPFATKQIQPLFSISEYLSFVSYYLFGCALIMLIPLIILYINRIQPLKPRQLFHYERHVIVIAFIVSAIMAPTVNIINLMLLAGPIILIYQIGIGLIWYINRYRRVASLYAKRDEEMRQEREKKASSAQPLFSTDNFSPPPKADTMNRPTRFVDVVAR